MHYTQGNTIFCSTYTIFDKELFPKYTNFYTREYKLYNKLLDKTSLETKLLVSNFSGKDRPALVPIPHTPIPPIQNNSLTYSPSPSLSYKYIFLPLTSRPKKPIVEIEEINNVDSDIEIRPLNPQWPFQSDLQTLQEYPELRRSKCQT